MEDAGVAAPGTDVVVGGARGARFPVAVVEEGLGLRFIHARLDLRHQGRVGLRRQGACAPHVFHLGRVLEEPHLGDVEARVAERGGGADAAPGAVAKAREDLGHAPVLLLAVAELPHDSLLVGQEGGEVVPQGLDVAGLIYANRVDGSVEAEALAVPDLPFFVPFAEEQDRTRRAVVAGRQQH